MKEQIYIDLKNKAVEFRGTSSSFEEAGLQSVNPETEEEFFTNDCDLFLEGRYLADLDFYFE